MKCPKCKKSLAQGVKFCPVCGAKVEKPSGLKIPKILLPLGVAIAGCAIGIVIASHLGREVPRPGSLSTTPANTENSITTSENTHRGPATESNPDILSILPGTYAERSSALDTLTIHKVNGNNLTFSVLWPAIWGFGEATATVNGNVAVFDYVLPYPYHEDICVKGTIEFEDNAAVLKITECNAYIKPGEYCYDLVGRELNDEQLREISKLLGVPETLETQTTQGEPTYWEGGGFYRTPVEIYHNGELIAGASVDSLSGGLAGNIYLYSGSSETVTADNGQEDGSFARTGNILRFGHYEQDGLRSNGTEPIEWLVLDMQENRVLLMRIKS